MQFRFLFFILCIFLVSSCAFAPKIVHLEPIETVSKSRFSKPTCILIGKFKDKRKDQVVIGHTYNLGVKTSDVRTYGNVSDWIRDAYSKEMTSAGAVECSANDQKIELTGSIIEIEQNESWNIKTLMKIELILEGTKEPFSKIFEAKSSQISHAASASEFTESLYKTLQVLLTDSIPVLISKAELKK